VVQPADTVFVVADLSEVWIVADVPEAIAGSVRAGQTVEVEIPAIPDRASAARCRSSASC
jgi:cobalt-zinc-cadmium efflux system membrane fusion protein